MWLDPMANVENKTLDDRLNITAKDNSLQDNLAPQVQRYDVSVHINWRTEPAHAVSSLSLNFQNTILQEKWQKL